MKGELLLKVRLNKAIDGIYLVGRNADPDMEESEFSLPYLERCFVLSGLKHLA